MKERLIRFAYAGTVFILSCIFGFWLIGGEINLSYKDKQDLLKILIPLITSPLLGFILSSIIKAILDMFLFKRGPFLKPNKDIEQLYLWKLFIKFKVSGVEKNEKGELYIKNKKIAYNCHQLILRDKNCNKEIIEYASRRLDYFWMQINILFSTLCGFLTGVFLNLYVYEKISDFNTVKSLWIIPIAIYIYCGIHSAIKSLKDLSDIEKYHIIDKI